MRIAPTVIHAHPEAVAVVVAMTAPDRQDVGRVMTISRMDGTPDLAMVTDLPIPATRTGTAHDPILPKAGTIPQRNAIRTKSCKKPPTNTGLGLFIFPYPPISIACDGFLCMP